MQVSAATLLRGGAEQGEEPGRNPGPPSRDTGERGTALGGGGALSQAFRERPAKRLCIQSNRPLQTKNESYCVMRIRKLQTMHNESEYVESTFKFTALQAFAYLLQGSSGRAATAADRSKGESTLDSAALELELELELSAE